MDDALLSNRCSSLETIDFAGHRRSYVVAVPDSLCGTVQKENISVPLVLAIHCYGCTAVDILRIFMNASNHHQFVLVAPEGIASSFNGQVCCGAAMRNNLDDVGLVRAIAQKLWRSPIVPGIYLSKDAVYAFGFSNGGFLASMVAQSMPEIRGFVALAGHSYSLPKKMAPRTVSLHWRRSDFHVRYRGCCASEQNYDTMCCCGISDRWTGQCISADAIFEYWLGINQCVNASVSLSKPGVSCLKGNRCLRPTEFCSYPTGYHPLWVRSFESEMYVGKFLAEDIAMLKKSSDHALPRSPSTEPPPRTPNARTEAPLETSQAFPTTSGTEALGESDSHAAVLRYVVILILLALTLIVFPFIARRLWRKLCVNKPFKRIPGDCKDATTVGCVQ